MRRSTLRDQTKSRVCKKNIKKLEGKKKTKLEFINIHDMYHMYFKDLILNNSKSRSRFCIFLDFNLL